MTQEQYAQEIETARTYLVEQHGQTLDAIEAYRAIRYKAKLPVCDWHPCGVALEQLRAAGLASYNYRERWIDRQARYLIH